MAEALAGWHALLAVARYAILWLILRRLGGCGLLATLGVLIAVLPSAIHGAKQSGVDVGLVFFVVLMTMTTSPRIAWGIPIIALPSLFAIWANAHDSVVIGLAWLGVLLAGRAVEWWKAREARPDLESIPASERLRFWPHVGRLAIVTVLCAAATCANPDGPRIYIEAFAAAKNPSVGTLPGWQPTDFSKPAGMPWMYFGSIAAILIVQLVGPRALSPSALIVIVTFGVWPLAQQRGADYWWLIVPWVLMPRLAAICNRRGAVEPEALGKDTVAFAGASGASASGRWAIGIICALAMLATPAMRWFISGSPRSLESIVSRDTPARLAMELTANEQSAGKSLPDLREQIRLTYPNGQYRGAILCGEDQGDFLAWVVDGDNKRPVMFYNRPEALDPDHWAECQKVLDGESSWWEITARHQVNLIAIDPAKHEKLADRLRAWPEWRTVQDDGPGGMFITIRRVPKLPVELMAP